MGNEDRGRACACACPGALLLLPLHLAPTGLQRDHGPQRRLLLRLLGGVGAAGARLLRLLLVERLG